RSWRSGRRRTKSPGKANKRLMEGIATANEQCGTRVSLETLAAISSTVNASLELDVVLRRALDQMLELFGFPTGTIRVLDPPTGELRLMAAAGLAPEGATDVSERIRVGDVPVGLAAQRRALVVVDDLAQSPYTDSFWARHGYRTFVSVPLQSRGML